MPLRAPDSKRGEKVPGTFFGNLFRPPKLKVPTMSYYRLVISRAFAKTSEFWNLHQVWKYAATPLGAVVLRLIFKRWKPVMGWHGFLEEAAIFLIFSFVVSWAGTFLINLIRVPPIIHAEQQVQLNSLGGDLARLREEQDDRNIIRFDFRLISSANSSTSVKAKITPIQWADIKVSGLQLSIWNLGPQHLTLSYCKLFTPASSDPLMVPTDLHVGPHGEDSLDITEEIAPLLFVQKDWSGFPEIQEVRVQILCLDESYNSASRDRSYKLKAKKIGGFSIAFKVYPAS